MLKHVVVWRFLEFAEGAKKADNVEKGKKLFLDLKEKIPQIISIEMGVGIPVDGKSFDLILYSEFENQEKLTKYQRHPEHIRVVEAIRGLHFYKAVIDYLV